MAKLTGPYIHPDQTPQERTEAARAMNRRRWAKVPAVERSRIAALAASFSSRRDPGKARCACGTMTLKRAQARGRGAGHHPGCPFHREPAGRP